jgi:ribosomal protein S18 acetylase RimI-like enzyme
VIIRDLTEEDSPWLRDLVQEHWGLPVVSVSRQYDDIELPGFVAVEDEERLGCLSYCVGAGGVEVVTLNSLVEGRGVATALLAAARELARARNARLWLITTNENMRAIGFYQRRGMDLVALHRDFVEVVRRAKPAADLSPVDGIAFRHALEFEYPAPATGAG